MELIKFQKGETKTCILRVTQKLVFEGYMYIVDRKKLSLKHIWSVKVVQFRGHVIATDNGSEFLGVANKEHYYVPDTVRIEVISL